MVNFNSKIILFLFFLLISTSLATAKIQGIDYDITTENGQSHLILYSYAKNEHIYNLTEANGTVVVNINGKKAYITLDPILSDTKLDLKQIKKNNKNTKFKADITLANHSYKFAWDLQDLPTELITKVDAYEINVESEELPVEIKGFKIKIENLIIDFRDIYDSGYDLKQSKNSLRIKSKKKSIKAKDIYFDPTSYTATKDSWIDQDAPTLNYGSSTTAGFSSTRKLLTYFPFTASIPINSTNMISDII